MKDWKIGVVSVIIDIYFLLDALIKIKSGTADSVDYGIVIVSICVLVLISISWLLLKRRGQVVPQLLFSGDVLVWYQYDPWGRFLNADALVATGQGMHGNNMFAYCNNNPVMYVDPTGHSLVDIIIKIANRFVINTIYFIRGFNEEEITFLSVVAGEAIGGTEREQKAVAHTIMNRLAEPRDSWLEVKTVSDILTKDAYKAVGTREYTNCAEYLEHRNYSNADYEALIYAVLPIYYGWESDFTNGAHFIFNVAGSARLLEALKAQPDRYQMCGPFEGVDPNAYCMYRSLY